MNQLTTEVSKICLTAGQAILDIYQTADPEVDYKQDQSPLTAADRESHRVIADALSQLDLPGHPLPILSEEGTDISYDERAAWDSFWLIDPLDGTKEFIKKNGEFTVNIALIVHKIPVWGMVYVPVKDTLYWGGEDGAWKQERASAPDAASAAPIRAAAYTGTGPVNVVASRSHLNEETKQYIDAVEQTFGSIEMTNAGSSIKLCLVAEGAAHVYPRFAPTAEWDTAAADAVCRAAGARVISRGTGQPLEYNKEDILNPWFLVSSDPRFEELTS